MTENFEEWLLQLENGELAGIYVDYGSAFYCSDLTSWFFKDVSDVVTDLISRIILSPQKMKYIT